MRHLKNKNLPIIIIFSTFLIIGIVIYADYGISWDEPYHRINGFVSLNFLRKIFFLDIYPGLEHDSSFLAENSKMYGVLFDLPMAFIEKKLLIDDPKNYFLFRHHHQFQTVLLVCSVDHYRIIWISSKLMFLCLFVHKCYFKKREGKA